MEDMRPDAQVIDRLFISPQNEDRLLDTARRQHPVYIFGVLPVLSQPYDVLPFRGSNKIVGQAPRPP